jgi:hypothetical protein
VGKTRGKLDEAKFFLQELEKHYPKCPESEYYLSAFFSSARSITWVMKHEYHDTEGWQAWWDGRGFTSGEELLLTATNKVRTRATKEEPLSANEVVMVRLPEQNGRKKVQGRVLELGEKMAASGGQGEFEWGRYKGKAAVRFTVGDESVIFPYDRMEPGLRLDELPEEDALEVCKQYLALLEELVTECEGRFGLGDVGSSAVAN